MHKLRAIRQAGAVLALVWLAAPLAAQVQPPVPPIPGPYPLAPVPLTLLANPGPAQPGGMMNQGMPPAMRLPYWMQQPSAPQGMGQAQAPAQTQGQNAPAAYAPIRPAGPQGYGQQAAPGYFPGYARQMPGQAMPMPGANTGGFAPQAYQPYSPQPFGATPGWGWNAPGGWGQPQAGGGRQ